MAFSSPARSLPRFRTRAGFTLVEVTLALGIVAFAFVALLALLPAGNTAFRRAIDMTVCSQIAQRVISDAQSSDFNTLTETTSSGDDRAEGFTFRAPLRYFDEQGREIIPAEGTTLSADEKLRAIYYVNMRVMPKAPLPRSPDRTVKVALNSATGELKPLNSLAQLTVEVAHNPSGLKLDFNEGDVSDVTKPERNLFIKGKKTNRVLDIFTFSAMVGRNS